MFFEMRFYLGTLDSGERSLPFGLRVFTFLLHVAVHFPMKNIYQSCDYTKPLGGEMSVSAIDVLCLLMFA